MVLRAWAKVGGSLSEYVCGGDGAVKSYLVGANNLIKKGQLREAGSKC